MKLSAWYEPDPKYVEIEVSIEDITRALCDEPDSKQAAFNLISSAYNSMKAITDEIIAGMTDAQRTTIKKALFEQSERF